MIVYSMVMDVIMLLYNNSRWIRSMIDLLKNYKELKNSSGYVGSLRYYLAKKKLDVVHLLIVDFVCEMD